MFLPSQIYDGVLVLESTENEDKEKKVKSLSRVRLFATLWTVACQAPRAVGFPRQEYWSGLPCLFVCFPSVTGWTVSHVSKFIAEALNFTT